MTSSVLVTDGEQRSTLAIVRSLGVAGHRMIVASSQPLPLAAASRYCACHIRTPDPASDPTGFVSVVAEACRREAADWLVPVSEAALRALLPARDRIPARIPFPTAGVFSAVSDKAAVLAKASELGIDVPRQVVAQSPADAALAISVGFPLVVKPSRSVADGHRLGVSYASELAGLRTLLAALPAAAYPVLLQERVTGPGTGIFLLTWAGSLYAAFAHRRVREKPPSGGVSVVAESIPADSSLVAQSRRLLDAFGWEGVAMVEYKHDLRSGRTVLMEVNGRFWGSLQLAVDSGVDFPRLLLASAQGRGHAVPPLYRIGVRSRWWWGDIDHLLTRLRRSARVSHLPADAPTRWRALLDFLTETGRNEVLRTSDLRPVTWETLNWLLRR